MYVHVCVCMHVYVCAADIISCVEFNRDGELLATGDRGGRVVIFQQEPAVNIVHFLSYTTTICAFYKLLLLLFIMPPPHYDGAQCFDGCCLSVCLSVCPMPDPQSRTEGHRKLKIGRKEAHDLGDP